jgi:hypothetical protein
VQKENSCKVSIKIALFVPDYQTQENGHSS